VFTFLYVRGVPGKRLGEKRDYYAIILIGAYQITGFISAMQYLLNRE
jgi:hypothetical protein